MADGIDIGEMPSYEFVPGAKETKRSATSYAASTTYWRSPGFPSRQELCLHRDMGPRHLVWSGANTSYWRSPGFPSRQELRLHRDMVSRHLVGSGAGQPQKKFGPRPRFEPVHFVVGTVEDDKLFQVTEKTSVDTSSQGKINLPHTSNVSVTVSDHSEEEKSSEADLSSSPCVYDLNMVDEQGRSDCSNFMTKMEKDYSAKFESHYSDMSKDFRSNVLDAWKDIKKQGREGIGFVKPPKTPSKFGKEIVPRNFGHKIQTLDKDGVINQLSTIVKINMQKLEMASGCMPVSYTHMLTQSVQVFKINPEFIYVDFKKIPPSNLPELIVPSLRFACEVRCQDVYLATGYSRNKVGAREEAAELAIQLLVKPMVKVLSVKRRFGHGYRQDLVVCSSDSPQTEFPPALKQEDGHKNKKGNPKGNKKGNQKGKKKEKKKGSGVGTYSAY